MTTESEKINYVLTEARVVLPGAQALLGFQLAIVLTSAFAELSHMSKTIHLMALLSIAFSTILFDDPGCLSSPRAGWRRRAGFLQNRFRNLVVGHWVFSVGTERRHFRDCRQNHRKRRIGGFPGVGGPLDANGPVVHLAFVATKPETGAWTRLRSGTPSTSWNGLVNPPLAQHCPTSVLVPKGHSSAALCAKAACAARAFSVFPAQACNAAVCKARP